MEPSWSGKVLAMPASVEHLNAAGDGGAGSGFGAADVVARLKKFGGPRTKVRAVAAPPPPFLALSLSPDPLSPTRGLCGGGTAGSRWPSTRHFSGRAHSCRALHQAPPSHT